jgi:hypothetical protein
MSTLLLYILDSWKKLVNFWFLGISSMHSWLLPLILCAPPPPPFLFSFLELSYSTVSCGSFRWIILLLEKVCEFLVSWIFFHAFLITTAYLFFFELSYSTVSCGSFCWIILVLEKVFEFLVFLDFLFVHS